MTVRELVSALIVRGDFDDEVVVVTSTGCVAVETIGRVAGADGLHVIWICPDEPLADEEEVDRQIRKNLGG